MMKCLNVNMSRIKELRTEKNLTQKEFAELVGVSITAIRSFEQGWRYIGNVSAIDVYRMAQILGTTIEDLLEVEPLQK